MINFDLEKETLTSISEVKGSHIYIVFHKIGTRLFCCYSVCKCGQILTKIVSQFLLGKKAGWAAAPCPRLTGLLMIAARLNPVLNNSPADN